MTVMRPLAKWMRHPLTILGAVVYVLVGGYLMFTIERPDGQISVGIAVGALVLALLIAGFILIRYWDWMMQVNDGSLRGVISACVVGVALMGSAAYFNWLGLNAIGGGEPLLYSGPVIGKSIVSGSRGSVRFLLEVKASDRDAPVMLKVNRSLYDLIEVGERVECEYRLGLFGVAYRWRNSDQPVCSIRPSTAVSVDSVGIARENARS